MIEGIGSEGVLPPDVPSHVNIPVQAKSGYSERHLVQVSKVKAIIKAEGLRTGKDFICALNQAVEQHIRCACDKVNTDGKRVTLGAEDL